MSLGVFLTPSLPLLAQTAGTEQVCTTVSLGDPQIDWAGPPTAFDNTTLDALIPSSYRDLTSMLTLPLYIDELLRRVSKKTGGSPALRLLGDIPNTPAVQEMGVFEAVLRRHPFRVIAGDNGNHASSNYLGVINVLSGAYKFLSRLLGVEGLLERELARSCGGTDNVLTPRKTMEGLHRMMHASNPEAPSLDELNTQVMRADEDGYDEWSDHELAKKFWKPVATTDAEGRHWECVVNLEDADRTQGERNKRPHPFYLQAHEEARFRLSDGSEAPVYSISLDTLDTDHWLTNFIAVFPGVSPFQSRLTQAFISERLRENPNARFKLCAHFPATRIAYPVLGKRPFLGRRLSWAFGGGRERRAFRELLSRPEVVLFTSGHTHKRGVHHLTQELGLERQTPLTEATTPSVIDYSPVQGAAGREHDARALTLEHMQVVSDSAGQETLAIDVEFLGLDQEDFASCLTGEMQTELEQFRRAHGWQGMRAMAKEGWKELTRYGFRQVGRFAKNTALRIGEFFLVLTPLHKKKLKSYWREQSFVENLMYAFTTLSIVQMFREGEQLIPFLRSLVKFIEQDEADSGAIAAKTQIQGVLTALATESPARQLAFQKDFDAGVRPRELLQYDDLFTRTGVHELPTILLNLPYDSQARSFAILAGIMSSREEYLFGRGKPTKISNQVPRITIPFSSVPPASRPA